MKVLIACEYSGRVRDAFLRNGDDAISCDLVPSERPGPHYQGDVRDMIRSERFDMMIAHPECTYLTYAATRSWNDVGRADKRTQAMCFFMEMINAPIDRIAVENPVGYPNTVYRKPDQIVHPYFFGEPFTKRTCLWLKNLPRLSPTNLLDRPPITKRWSNGKSAQYVETVYGTRSYKSRTRSRTFEGIAQAMADQWG